jgi:hypothetical protein
VDANTTLPVGLVAELLPKLRKLSITSVQPSQQGFTVHYRHKTRHTTVSFQVDYGVYLVPKTIPGGVLQSLNYEGNGVHVLKLARRPALAGTVIGVEGLTFLTPLDLKTTRRNKDN